MKTKFTLYILCYCLVIGGTALLGVYLYAVSASLPHGMRISGWKPQAADIDAFQKEWKGRLEKLKGARIELTPSDSRLTPAAGRLEDAGIYVDDKDVWKQLESLRSGSWVDRAKARWKLRNGDIPVEIAVEPEALQRTVNRAWPSLSNRKPVNAKRVISADDQITYLPGQATPQIDVPALAISLKAAVRDRLLPSNLEDTQTLYVHASIKEQSPAITVEMLKQQGIQRKFMEFATPILSDQQGRIYNVQSTAAVLHDQMLLPNQIFEYSAIVKETEARYGYKEAPVISNGKLLPGIGGGICQVSTTLYGAVLRAGLEIIERRNHSLPVGYAPLGQDATFADNYLNFRFRNTTGRYLLIRTVVTETTVTVKLFGDMPSNVTHEIESNILKTIQPKVKYVQDSSLPPGSSQLLAEGKPGYIVETYRTKKQDGRKVHREKISRDHYLAQPTVIAVHSVEGSAPNEPNPYPQIVEDGLRTLSPVKE